MPGITYEMEVYSLSGYVYEYIATHYFDTVASRDLMLMFWESKGYAVKVTKKRMLCSPMFY